MIHKYINFQIDCSFELFPLKGGCDASFIKFLQFLNAKLYCVTVEGYVFLLLFFFSIFIQNTVIRYLIEVLFIQIAYFLHYWIARMFDK